MKNADYLSGRETTGVMEKVLEHHGTVYGAATPTYLGPWRHDWASARADLMDRLEKEKA